MQPIDEDPSIFFDGFLRTFLLGLSMGGVFEVLHVASKVGLLSAQTLRFEIMEWDAGMQGCAGLLSVLSA
jgi:hypothetical protein